MHQVREVLRLKHVCGHSGQQIAAMVGVSHYTVAEYLRRAAVVGITWPVPAALDDVTLERRLFTPPFTPEPEGPQPEWARIHAELRRPGVTLVLLWEEYRAGEPDVYGYSRLCDLACDWRGRLWPTMRKTHPAGERLFVDCAAQIACDNLKAGGIAVSRYEPSISRTSRTLPATAAQRSYQPARICRH